MRMVTLEIFYIEKKHFILMGVVVIMV